MPCIKPFKALKPAYNLQSKVVTRPLENYSTGEARLIVSENEYSFLHLISPELDNPYLRGTKQELVFKKIIENLDHFIEKEFLVKAEESALYIYRVFHDGLVQTGIWTLTHIRDYIAGNIKKHEHTVERREKLLADYLQQTGLDANPVLITYHPNAVISNILAEETLKQPMLDFKFNDGSKHQIWQIVKENNIELIASEFSKMPNVYIADGHHRIASMTKMGLQRAKLNNQHTGLEDYNYFTTVYMDTNQVKVLEFNRLVRDLGDYSKERFLSILNENFKVIPSNNPVKPTKLHELGMYLIDSWYFLYPKNAILNDNDPVQALDVSILHDFILDPVLNIVDPRTDARLNFQGGIVSIPELQRQVDSKAYSIAFTLFPTSITQLISVADAGKVMPPKSTWVEPKFLAGLLTYRFS